MTGSTSYKCVCLTEDEYQSEEEDEEEEGEDFEDDDSQTVSTARPRRMSEIKIANKVKPIPPFSSLFVLSPTNRYE